MFAKFGKKALRTLAKATRGTSIVFPRAKMYPNEHTSPTKRPATTLDTAFGCDVCEIWQKALRTLANAIDCTSIVFPRAKMYPTNIQALKNDRLRP